CKSSSFATLKHTIESHSNSTSPVLSQKENKQSTLFQNGHKNYVERVHLSHPAFRLSPCSRPVGLTHLPFTPPVSPACPPIHPNSRSSTPDGCTLSPSPTVPSRQISPSPSYSFCSSPSSSLWGSTPDCADGDCKNRKKYKIKSTYKALAAIPTNTLLLEQHAIDEEVNKKEASFDPADSYSWKDPHAEMCSPAQLRQQTTEMYATFDEVLEDSIQRRQSKHVDKANVKSLAAEASRPQTSAPSPKWDGKKHIKTTSQWFGDGILESPPDYDRAHQSPADKPRPLQRPRSVIVWLQFQQKEKIICEARVKRGKLYYCGIPNAIFGEYAPEVLKQRSKYR
ncbi:muscular LMNA-interacting protein-like, partial [Cyprinus carpio]|uniref:Muscular LMNA-interacting protein-like n=1 Tax=Cyprinus carpio TaxID=7962 RepID=A0A9R0B7B0_CYPCA